MTNSKKYALFRLCKLHHKLLNLFSCAQFRNIQVRFVQELLLFSNVPTQKYQYIFSTYTVPSQLFTVPDGRLLRP